MTVAQHGSAGVKIGRKGKVPLGTAEIMRVEEEE